MKTQSEKYNEMMEKANAATGVTADVMTISLLSSIADSLAVIADASRQEPKKTLYDHSDIRLANEIALVAKKYTNPNMAMMEISQKVAEVLGPSVRRDFKVYEQATLTAERHT